MDLKMDFIFKSQYHTHFLMDSNVSSFNMHVKKLYSWVFIHIICIISLTTFNPSLKQCYHNRLQIVILPNGFLWTIYPPKLVHFTL
jgi:hypothetical protein